MVTFFRSKHLLLLLLVFLLAFSLRAYKFGSIPLGLNTDETAIGYNAYSILETGKDEYGHKMPLYFKSFGDYKLPVYIYSTSASIKVFGPTEFAVRFPSLLFGLISIFSIYFLVRFLSNNKTFALLAAFLLAINPWHMFFSRTGFEVNVALSLILLGTLAFVLAVKFSKYRLVWIALSVVFFLLSTYCYNATRVLSPVLFLTMMAYFKFTNKKIDTKVFIFAFTLFCLGMIPFIISFLRFNGIQNQSALLIVGGDIRAQMLELRSYFATTPIIFSKIFFNTVALVIWQFFKNLISFFSVDFFFINGAQHPINSVTNYGMFHIFEVFLIPTGLYYGIKKKVTYLYPFYLWIIVMILLVSITREVPHPTRTYGILFPFIIFSAFGLLQILKNVQAIKKSYIKNALLLSFIGLFIYSFAFYVTSYFHYFPIKYAQDWRAKDQELALYIKSIEKDYDKIIIDEEGDVAYTSLLFYGQYPPQKLHENQEYGADGLLTTLRKFGKYEYRKIDWGQDKNLPKTLFITRNHKNYDWEPLKVITFPTKRIVFFYDNKFQKIEPDETAYIIYRAP